MPKQREIFFSWLLSLELSYTKFYIRRNSTSNGLLFKIINLAIQTLSIKMKRKGHTKRIIFRISVVIILILVAGFTFLYYNLNKILTNALSKSFQSSIISDVYELKFDKLTVNLFAGNVSVYNVELKQLENSLSNYPYINSSLHLKTNKMILKNVQISTLIQDGILKLDKIEIIEPAVDFNIEDKIPVFFPLKDTAASQSKKTNKRYVESFVLKEFDLVNASFHSSNKAREREFNIKKLNFSIRDLLIDQKPGKDLISYKNVHISIGEFTGNLQKRALRYLTFKDFNINIDSLNVEQTSDTSVYQFADFSTGLKGLEIQTADSLFSIAMQSFDLSYKDSSIKLNDIIFKPNVSQAKLQAAYKFQHTDFSGSVSSLYMTGVNFDSLMRKGKIFIDKVTLDKVSASIYKDKSKPVDTKKFPQYPGQSVKAISTSVLVKQVKATNVTLVNKERNPDGSIATANLNRATLEVKNISNLSSNNPLVIKANAYIENKAPLSLSLGFDYLNPQFSFDGRLEKFNLQDLNPLIEAYTPASIKKGTVDEITFSGMAYRSSASGTMKFLYHDLDINVDIEGKAKWKSSVLAFGANSILPAANPASADKPQRIVKFSAERDMNKAFVNLVIKSVLNGLKETMIMSKENKKTYREENRELKKERKKQNKKEKN